MARPTTPGDRTVLVTSHGAYILTLLRQLVSDSQHGGLAYEVLGQAAQHHPFRHCANTSIAVVKIDAHGHGVVERFNDHVHLGKGAGKIESQDVAA
ncbi:hypothetical protein QFC22_006025 [Naganishia vaughanmartiniae]|uniref:Uncharacterized protein n=1 Tax=Naganishia vaughanmartiniae TaxID=1424756 RepID=A0ACC2WQS8_9TREE|nr:hypothetical protein QFC22_006025 [Naganishia vaughanmartiniae]